MVARGVKLSDERKRASAEGRAAARERERIIGFPVRCAVRVNTPREPRFNGRSGTVSEHNMGEVGVRFAPSEPAVWFLPEHLIRVATEKKHTNTV